MTNDFYKYTYYKIDGDIYRLEEFVPGNYFCSVLRKGRKGKWVWSKATMDLSPFVKKEGIEIHVPILENITIKDGKKEVSILDKPIIEIKQKFTKQNQAIKETNQLVKETDSLIIIGNEVAEIKHKEKIEDWWENPVVKVFFLIIKITLGLALLIGLVLMFYVFFTTGEQPCVPGRGMGC